MELTCTDLEKQGTEKRGYGADERGIDMDWFRIMLATLLAGLTGCIAYLSIRWIKPPRSSEILKAL